MCSIHIGSSNKQLGEQHKRKSQRDSLVVLKSYKQVKRLFLLFYQKS